MLATHRVMISSLLTVLLLAGASSSVFAETTPLHSPQVTKQLQELKRTAFAIHSEADALNSITPNQRLSWESHADRLQTLKTHVNKMGKSLAELETQGAIVTEEQALAMEHARLHLVPVAQNLTDAIELVNEDRRSVHGNEYDEAVSDLYTHAEALHTKLDTILDYENARMRFDRLELQPSFSSGE